MTGWNNEKRPRLLSVEAAAYIRSIVKARQELPTDRDLARQYGVSVSLVRKIGRGVLYPDAGRIVHQGQQPVK